MKEEKIIDINGSKYNASTGKPVLKSHLSQSAQAVRNKNNHIKNVQSITQKSRDIYNRAAGRAVQSVSSPIKKIGRSMDIARSKKISHFASKTTINHNKPTEPVINKQKSMDLGPIKHPIARNIQNKVVAVEKIPSQTVKENAISEALNSATSRDVKTKNKRRFKYINVFTVSFSLLLLIVFVTYLSLPIISVKIASAQAGIDANYPEYRPDGYSLSGPVTYSAGEVVMNFRANAGKTEFSIRQSKSSWDSTAVRDKINKDLNGEFITTEEKGLTIYTYGGNATWVNGGILYSITGDAPLKSDQIRRIATSL